MSCFGASQFSKYQNPSPSPASISRKKNLFTVFRYHKIYEIPIHTSTRAPSDTHTHTHTHIHALHTHNCFYDQHNPTEPSYLVHHCDYQIWLNRSRGLEVNRTGCDTQNMIIALSENKTMNSPVFTAACSRYNIQITNKLSSNIHYTKTRNNYWSKTQFSITTHDETPALRLVDLSSR
jgi:hypothetical protein